MGDFKATLVCVPKTGRPFEIDLTDKDWVPETGDMVQYHGFVGKVIQSLLDVEQDMIVVTAKEGAE